MAATVGVVTSVAAVDPWEFELHPEVWVLVGAIVALGLYATRVIGPLAVGTDEVVVTRGQRVFFVAGVCVLWVAADWPMHDIAEQHLYSVHMVQHLLISFIVPPLLLLAMPEWLARLVVLDDSVSGRLVRVLTRPVVAGVAFNAVQVFTHWGAVVDLSSGNGGFHYAVHLLVFVTALMMWFPVLGPLREVQMGEPAKMLYLFLMSIVPTVPAAWLTFAEGAVYDAYDNPERLWGLSVAGDQQLAGMVMKTIGGFYLWALIAIRFFRYSASQSAADAAARRVARPGTLTTADVNDEFRRAGEPVRESGR